MRRSNLGRAGRSYRIADQDRPRRDHFGEPGQQTAIAVPGAAETEAPAEQKHRSPGPVGGWVIHIAEANISDASPPAHLRRARRGIDSGDRQASLLQVQGRPARASAQIQDRASGALAVCQVFLPTVVSAADLVEGRHGTEWNAECRDVE